MEQPPPNKDSYDKLLEFSRITEKNWLLPDRKDYVPLDVGEQQWIVPFLQPQLAPTVPREVLQAFEIARGCMIYSWFFYPLATLGLEHCTRIGELAVRKKCELENRATDNFWENLQTLVKIGVITKEELSRWEACRKLRNDRSHLDGYMLMDPGAAVYVLQSTADLINALYSTTATRPTARN